MSLEDIPQVFADTVGINLLSAQVILSVVLIFALLLPTMILTKGKAPTIYLMVFLLAECLLVGLGWLNFWVLIATVCIMVMSISAFGAKIVTGDG